MTVEYVLCHYASHVLIVSEYLSISSSIKIKTDFKGLEPGIDCTRSEMGEMG